MFAGKVLIGGKESEIHILEMFRPDGLHKTNFVTHRFKLSQGFVIIQEFDVAPWEVALAEHICQLFPLEGCGPHDGHAVITYPVINFRTRRRRMSGLVHCSSGASV